jgi:hypothetical protein
MTPARIDTCLWALALLSGDFDQVIFRSRVTITDAEGATACGCLQHVVAALDGITGAYVDWDSMGLNGSYQRPPSLHCHFGYTGHGGAGSSGGMGPWSACG